MSPLCTLRYSATHADKHHMVFRLDAVDAYERKLVKQIEVASATVEDSHNKPYVRLLSVSSRRGAIDARVELDVKKASGVRRQEVTVQDGDLLELTTDRAVYHDCRVGEIRVGKGTEFLELRVPGGEHYLRPGQAWGDVDAMAVEREMIRRTIDRRLLHGGLPGPLLSERLDPGFFEDWIDSFYARDIQELFGVRKRTGFMALLRLVALRNGGLLDVTDLARQSGTSRPTVMSHLDAMEIAHAIRRVPPYHSGGEREIVRRPKIYAFDTGLVASARGWETLREDDRGPLWENLVLDELCATCPPTAIHYWRDKSRREVDFVVVRPEGRVDAVEAKISPDAFGGEALAEFRRLYSKGDNYLMCPYVREPYTITRSGLSLKVCSALPPGLAGPPQVT